MEATLTRARAERQLAEENRWKVAAAAAAIATAAATCIAAVIISKSRT